MSRVPLEGEIRELFDEFVKMRRSGPSPEEEPVEGMGLRTLRRYIIDGKVPTSVSHGTVAAMAAYMASHGDSRWAHLTRSPVKKNGASPEVELRLARQIENVLEGPGEDWHKRYMVAEIHAAYGRLERIVAEQARREAERAARLRARALERAESRGLLRERLASYRELGPDAARQLWEAHDLLEDQDRLQSPQARRRPRPGPHGPGESGPGDGNR